MDRSEDIRFLRLFRELVDLYLILGYSPHRRNSGYKQMQEVLESAEFQELRQRINQMKPRVTELLEECKVSYILIQYPPPAVGGPIVRTPILDLLIENRISRNIRKQEFFDVIDQAIGKLTYVSTSTIQELKEPGEIKQGFVFIAMPMSSDDHDLEDTHEAIKEVSHELGLVAERIDDPVSNERITDRILESLRQAEYVIADLTYSKPNVYWEAGYAHALGKIPIYIARIGTNIEFDLKDYPVIFFKNITHLKRGLKSRLLGLRDKKGNT